MNKNFVSLSHSFQAITISQKAAIESHGRKLFELTFSFLSVDDDVDDGDDDYYYYNYYQELHNWKIITIATLCVQLLSCQYLFRMMGRKI